MSSRLRCRCIRGNRAGSRVSSGSAWLLLLVVATPVFAAGGGSPMGGGDTVTLEPVPASSTARPPPPQRRLVFTCITPGLVIFADRPCGPLPELRELRLDPGGGTQVLHGAGPTVAGRQEADARANRPSAVSSRATARPEPEDAAERESRERAAACERLERAVRDLDQRLRAGYSAREAGRLWARWREARERLRDARC